MVITALRAEPYQFRIRNGSTPKPYEDSRSAALKSRTADYS
jgi:hypothetical protein